MDLGPLQHHLDIPGTREVMVLGNGELWIDSPSGLHCGQTLTSEEVARCIERIVRLGGRRVDTLNPIADIPLPDGSRACVVLPPIAVDGPTISIRTFSRRVLPLSSFGNERCAAVLTSLIHDRANVIVSGATSSGKTSLVSSIGSQFPHSDRVVTVEDTAELRLQHPHVVRLQTRPANMEGVGEIDLANLVRASLRLRPDRIVVGEVRGAEAVDMLLALTAGHSGSWSTVHAHGAHDTVDRLVDLVMRGSPQWTDSTIRRTVARAVQAIVHVERTSLSKRQIAHVVSLQPDGDDVSFSTLFSLREETRAGHEF